MAQIRFPSWALRRGYAAWLVMGVVAAAASVAWTAPVDIVNPSFEDITGESPYNEFTFGPLAGWDLYDPSDITDGGDGPTYFIGTLDPTASGQPSGSYPWFPDGATHGQRVAISFNYAGSGDTGEYGLTQTLTHILAPNTSYTLQVDIGNIASGTAIDTTFYNLDGFPGYRVDLLAGGELLAQDDNTLAATVPEGEFLTSTVIFTTGDSHAQLGQALTIRLVNLNLIDPTAPGAHLEVDFDNVRLDATIIPEPATVALALPAIAAVLVRRRRV